jgi:DNA (cytosine-5)-methyltransferase 1
LTENRGEELLTLYLADFHAKTSAQQDEAQELQEKNQECGNTWRGSLARLDPNTSLWKTAQCSLLEDLELSLQTFPKWGLMQNGALYPLQTLVQTISVKESGLEPNNETFFHTPNTTGMDGGSNSRKALKKRMWLTPRVVEVDESPENFRRRMNSKRPNDRKDGFGSLTMQVKAIQKWPTPTASDGTSGAVIGKNDTFYTTSTGMPRKVNQNGKDGSVGLGRLVQMWPTPSTSSI